MTTRNRSPSSLKLITFGAAGLGLLALYQILKRTRMLAGDAGDAGNEAFEFEGQEELIQPGRLSAAVATEAAHARRRAHMPIDVAAEVADSLLM